MNKIEQYLLDYGIKPSLKGFKILTKAIEKCMSDEKYFELHKELYPKLEEEMHLTALSINGAMRNAINTSKNKNPIDLKNFIFLAVLNLKD